MKMGAIILYERNKGAMMTVYSEAASTQAEQSSGDAWRCGAIAVPWCTVVSGQIDLNTGGVVGDPDEKANSPK